MLTADTITDEQIRDLARFAVAECFRALGKPNADKVDAALAKLVGSSTRAVSADAIRLYCDSGMLTRPAAGQLTLTSKGRGIVDAARARCAELLNAHAKEA